MDWQQLVSLGIVGIAGILLARSKLRRRRFRFGHDSHCGCGGGGGEAPGGRIIFRARKGQRPEIVVRTGP